MKEMNIIKLILILVFAGVLDFALHAFDHTAGGYLKNLQSVSFTDPNGEWSQFNAWNFRLNAKLFPTDNLILVFGGNAFFIYSGSTAGQSEYANEGYYSNAGTRDLSAGYTSRSYTAGVFSDRMYFEYIRNKLSLSGGYQRINWGMNAVWNPNDIFNAYSVYDIDYEERPGILSLRARIFTGPASNFDIVAAPDEKYGAMYRTNIKGTDIQFICGYGEKEIIVATGFESGLMTAGLKVEYTHFYDTDSKTEGHIAAANIIHTLKNGTGITTGLIYNSYGSDNNALLRKIQPGSTDPVKNLSAGKYSALGQLSYPFTPLLYGSATALMNLSDFSLYLSPQLIFSMFEDLEFFLAAQLHTGRKLDEFSNMLGRSVFIRLRYSF